MKINDLSISYSVNFSGTDKTQVSFYDSIADLTKVFNLTDANDSANDSANDGAAPYTTADTKNDTATNSSCRYFFVTDATVASLDFMQNFISLFDDGVCGRHNLMILGSGEPYKTIESTLRIVSEAFEAGFNRNDVFVGIGGGVICDVTAFAASIYKRGVQVQFVPTTLLAMVDAAIGGKTGCDFENTKNIIGTFHPASNLYYFPEFLQSLPENQFNSGLAEAFKTALLYDKELYDLFKTESEQIKARTPELLYTIISSCVSAKAAVVEKDLMENNIRVLLNLGHTFAHALESLAGLGIVTHGAAVAWGIGRSVEMACKKGYCLESFREEIFSTMELYGWETEPVPSVVRGGGVGERFISVMHKDKKIIDEKIRVVILKDFCTAITEEADDSEILLVLK